MDTLLLIIGICLVLAGIAGALIPGLPGPPLSFIALVMLQFRDGFAFSPGFLVTMGIIMAVVTVVDYVIPIYGTRKFGGTRRGVWGSTIGLIVGLFILPLTGIVLGPLGLFGIILGPFLGAYIGETTGGMASEPALRAALGSFIGFLAGTMMKLAYSVVVAVYFFINL